MPSEILSAALRYKADLAAREAVAMRSMAANWLTTMRGLEGEIDDLARIMAARRAAGQSVTAGYLYRTERYQQLLQQSYAQFIRYEDFAADLIARNTATFARLGREYGLGLLDVLEPGIGGGFNRLNVGAIENIAGFVERGPLRALLADAWPHAIEQTTSALVRGVALGYGPERIARMMNEGMSSGLYRSMVIARTKTQRAYRTNKMDVWRETGLVRGFQRVSTHDRRVCPACLFAEGQFIPVQGDFAEHPQGRCSLIPVTRNGELHRWQYGPEWYEQQPVSTQVSILGPGRHAAWKAGKFDLRDVPAVQANDTWGPSLRARGLAELTGQGRGVGRVVAPEIVTTAFEMSPTFEPYISRSTGKAADSTFTVGQIGNTKVAYREMGFENQLPDAEAIRKIATEVIDPAFARIPAAHREMVDLIVIEDFKVGFAMGGHAGASDITIQAIKGQAQLGPSGLIHEVGHVVHKRTLTDAKAREWAAATGWDDPDTALDMMKKATAKDMRPYEYIGATEYGTFHPVEAFAESYRLKYQGNLTDLDGLIVYPERRDMLGALLDRILE